MAVNHHDFIVGDGVLGINESRDVGVEQKVCFAVSLCALAFVEDDGHIHAALVGVNKGFGNRRGCE